MQPLGRFLNTDQKQNLLINTKFPNHKRIDISLRRCEATFLVCERISSVYKRKFAGPSSPERVRLSKMFLRDCLARKNLDLRKSRGEGSKTWPRHLPEKLLQDWRAASLENNFCLEPEEG